jgi:hypothetical protein
MTCVTQLAEQESLCTRVMLHCVPRELREQQSLGMHQRSWNGLREALQCLPGLHRLLGCTIQSKSLVQGLLGLKDRTGSGKNRSSSSELSLPAQLLYHPSSQLLALLLASAAQPSPRPSFGRGPQLTLPAPFLISPAQNMQPIKRPSLDGPLSAGSNVCSGSGLRPGADAASFGWTLNRGKRTGMEDYLSAEVRALMARSASQLGTMGRAGPRLEGRVSPRGSERAGFYLLPSAPDAASPGIMGIPSHPFDASMLLSQWILHPESGQVVGLFGVYDGEQDRSSPPQL